MHMPATDGEGYVADIQITPGVHRYPVRRNELRRALALFGFAKSRQQLAV
jgi:hypothetical protein